MVTKLNLFDNFNQLTPYAVGFDRVFDQLNNYASHNATSSGFPPYNIRKEGDYSFVIELALAGFSKKDIEVEVADGLRFVQLKRMMKMILTFIVESHIVSSIANLPLQMTLW